MGTALLFIMSSGSGHGHGTREEGCDRGGKHVLDDTTGAAEGSGFLLSQGFISLLLLLLLKYCLEHCASAWLVARWVYI